MRYLLQEENIEGFKDLVFNEIAVEAIPSLSLKVWDGNIKETDILTATLGEIARIPSASLYDVVPIGSIEFVEAVMKQAYMVQQLTPVNVPQDLSITSFWKRRLAFCSGAEAVKSVYEDWNVNELFIKSAKRLKTDITGIYKKGQEPERYDKEPLLIVSEVLPMKTDKCSEWRTFIMNRNIIDIRCYSGNPWVMPDKSIVEEMARKIPNSLRCCTLDVAVTDNGDTVIIELHNFISCGTYGAEVPLSMYRFAYLDELKRHGIIPELPLRR